MNNILLYDVHTHTNMDPMINEIDKIIDVCKTKNIIYNCIGTEIDDSLIACYQARKYKGVVYATIGIHPDNVKDLADVDKLEEIYKLHKDEIVAIGEIGLDYHGENKNIALQKEMFKAQIQLANKYDLPICIHVRDAEEDCLEILKLAKNPNKVWIHCFAKGPELAKKYIDRGYMLSIPGIITFKNAKEVNDAIKVIPLDKIMVETDGPWLAPVPMRGKTNYPYYVEYTAADIAHKLNMDVNEFNKKVTENSINFFNIK